MIESNQKHPGGWETALAVKHFLKRNSSGAVAPYTFLDEHYLKFSRGKLNDVEGMSWYLQGFCGCGEVGAFSLFFAGVSLLQAFAQGAAAACGTEEVSGISTVPSTLPNPYSLKQLRVHSTIFTCAPRG